MTYTQRQTKTGTLTFTLVNEEDKWSRIISGTNGDAYGTIIQTIEYLGGFVWTFETIVKTDKPGRWVRSKVERVTAQQVQAIAHEWRKEF